MSAQSRRIAALLEDHADDHTLEDVLEQVKAALKAAPTDHDIRHLYIDVLILSGQYERADQQCDLAAKFQPADAVGFSILRQQIRAMAARQAWFETGAVPDFPSGPTDLDQMALKLGLAIRDGALDLAVDIVAQMEDARAACPMIYNGKSVADWRDLDDRIPHALEVLTTGGAYLWVDFRKIENVSVEPIARSRDLAFRPAQLTLNGGAVASVLLPAVYHSSSRNPALQLARETAWEDLAAGLVVGQGQKCFLADDEIVSLHEVSELDADSMNGERRIVHG
ncbi:type VI secretion system accessory protein TagJ [Allorhizobium terrae]|uniref:Nitrogen fixation protein n=1 Tax=Allorhizobium terrae TaxID=1848972 RepID=A0A4S3ZQG1_9HYPH|nr:type VI secretion system accessory protein TagJ [Allorhizobium terrae]THF47764.1 nitrogen fixation protein [Allorhizobium terrae]